MTFVTTMMQLAISRLMFKIDLRAIPQPRSQGLSSSRSRKREKRRDPGNEVGYSSGCIPCRLRCRKIKRKREVEGNNSKYRKQTHFKISYVMEEQTSDVQYTIADGAKDFLFSERWVRILIFHQYFHQQFRRRKALLSQYSKLVGVSFRDCSSRW